MTNVIELARQAGASRYTNRHYPDRPTHTFTVDQLELYTKLVRNAALEEAAQKSANLHEDLNSDHDCRKRWSERSRTNQIYAEAIRNLKETKP